MPRTRPAAPQGEAACLRSAEGVAQVCCARLQAPGGSARPAGVQGVSEGGRLSRDGLLRSLQVAHSHPRGSRLASLSQASAVLHGG